MKKILVPLRSSFHVETIADYAAGLLGNEEFFLSVMINESPQTKIIKEKFDKVIPAFDFVPFERTAGISTEVLADDQLEGLHNLMSYCSDKRIRLKISIAAGNNWTKALTDASAYADVIFLPYENPLDHPTSTEERTLFTDMLHHLHCPVLLLPQRFVPPQHIILTYDHSPSSVHAIKQFNSLFAGFCRNTETTLVTVGDDLKEKLGLDRMLEELISAKFPGYHYKHLDGSVVETLQGCFQAFTAPIMTLGSFGRSRLSEFFMPAVGEELIRKDLLPLFIAH